LLLCVLSFQAREQDYEQWREVFTLILTHCEALRRAAVQRDRVSFAVS
jgi:hypothetical protein